MATEDHGSAAWVRRAADILEHVDPQAVQRLKGLRLIGGYALATLLSALLARAAPAGLGLGVRPGAALMAANIALWASVSEMQDGSRRRAACDLIVLCAAAAAGAIFQSCAADLLRGHPSHFGADLMPLVAGVFLVGWLRRFGALGAGVGSQWYIGQILAQGLSLTPVQWPVPASAALLAACAAVCCRLMPGIGATRREGTAANPAPTGASPAVTPPAALAMGLQAALAASIVVAIDAAFGLRQPVWAITACAYVVAATMESTFSRGRQRIVGTVIGVALAFCALPLAEHHPWAAWVAAAPAMMLYALALPRRYDVACAAYALTLVLTLAAGGEHSLALLASRAWETLLGALIALAVARSLLPLRATTSPRADPMSR
jgi:hypothetical protein